jgi:hypothetical protein
VRPDQNQEFRRIVRDLMIPRILSGQKFGNFKEDGWECKFYTAKKNQNQMVIEVTFLGEWSAMHFRGFCPDSFLSELPMFAKYGTSNKVTEPERVRWRESVTVFCKRNAVQAWQVLQERKKVVAAGIRLTDRELHKKAVEHGHKFLFADDDGEVKLTRIEGDAVQFIAHKRGVGYVFEVDPVTGAVESKRNRAYDLEQAA